MKKLLLLILLPIFLQAQYKGFGRHSHTTLNIWTPIAPSVTSQQAFGANLCYIFPVEVTAKLDVDSVAIYVAANVAGGKVRVGVYTWDGNLVTQSADLDAATTGSKKAAINLTLEPGRYFLAHASSSVTIQLLSVNLAGWRLVMSVPAAGNYYGHLTTGLANGILAPTIDPSGFTDSNSHRAIMFFWKD